MGNIAFVSDPSQTVQPWLSIRNRIGDKHASKGRVMPGIESQLAPDTLSMLQRFEAAIRELVLHIACTRGPRAPYYSIHQDRSPWPNEAVDTLRLGAPTVVAYLRERHALDVAESLQRIQVAGEVWLTKRERILEFSTVKRRGRKAFFDASKKLTTFAEEGLAEQRRLDLDLSIVQGAFWLAAFPLLAERFGRQRPFVIRRNYLFWALWVSESLAQAVKDWPMPSEMSVEVGTIEEAQRLANDFNQQRWELVNVISPRHIPNTHETPLKRIAEAMDKFVAEAVRWPTHKGRPTTTEDLVLAVNEVEELTGRDDVEAHTLFQQSNRGIPANDGATHGPDFRNVNWFGTKHLLTPKQAACLKHLWMAWEQGTPWLADGTVLEKAGVGDRQRLRDVFRRHPAWGTMIIKGPQQDLHGLQPPHKT